MLGTTGFCMFVCTHDQRHRRCAPRTLLDRFQHCGAVKARAKPTPPRCGSRDLAHTIVPVSGCDKLSPPLPGKSGRACRRVGEGNLARLQQAQTLPYRRPAVDAQHGPVMKVGEQAGIIYCHSELFSYFVSFITTAATTSLDVINSYLQAITSCKPPPPLGDIEAPRGLNPR